MPRINKLGALSDDERLILEAYRTLDSSTKWRVKAFFGGLPLAADKRPSLALDTPKEKAWASNPTARESVVARVRALGTKFLEMNESEYGDWVDTLAPDEFIEFVAIGLSEKA